MIGRLNELGDRVVAKVVRGYFSKTSLLLHLIFYPVLMAADGGDFHRFLDGISIEAVFVGLMVGISTKTVIDQHHGMRRTLHALVEHLTRKGVK